MAYNALDVARFIINYGNEKGYSISNLKLQKILYFIQADFIAYSDKHEPCFNEEIEAWNFGPVIPEVYHEFKEFGSGRIPSIKKYIDLSKGIWDSKIKEFSNNIISEEDAKRIKGLVDQSSKYSATQLVEISHKQKPWKNAYQPYMNNIITKRSISKYFLED